MARWLVASVLAVAAASCTPPPPRATASDAARANVALADLERGRTLLLNRCSSCHRAPMPADQRASNWPHEVADMAARAKIDDAQQHLITLYLVAMSTH
jgi:uncharacterized membrane protein